MPTAGRWSATGSPSCGGCPATSLAWLEHEDDHTTWAYFTEHRLRPVTRIADQEEQVRNLAVMIEEAREGATSSSD